MHSTLRTLRDRAGHALLILVVLAYGTAEAKPGDYKAQRFDVTARAVEGGALEVTETITFEFQSGTFTKVWREIPASRTDGIEVVSAALDETPLTPGDGPGHFSVSGRSPVRVEWRFAETGPSVHRFELRYRARGVVYRDADADVLRWRALPAQHGYPIDASRIVFDPSDARVMPLETQRVASAHVSDTSGGLTIEATGIRRDGWIVAELRYPAGTLVSADPGWRARAARARALAPAWAIGAAAAFAGALLLLMVARQGGGVSTAIPDRTAATEPPQPLPVAVATALAAKGRMATYGAVTTLVDLADRGVLTVRESKGVFGVRQYTLARLPDTPPLEPHEREALAIAFGDDREVPLTTARHRLRRKARQFSAAVQSDLAARGFIDPSRKAAHDRITRLAVVMLLVGGVAMVAPAALAQRYGAWPFLVPGAIVAAAIVGLILAATSTPLSDAGLVEAARWRGFKRHLRRLASGDAATSAASVPSRWIVYAVGLGLGLYWARFLKRHPGLAPAWFVADGGDVTPAFAAFIGSSHGASAGGGAAGGGAAAGGGGSGAG